MQAEWKERYLVSRISDSFGSLRTIGGMEVEGVNWKDNKIR